MQEKKLLRRAMLAAAVLLCLCILFSQYAHRTFAAEAALLRELTPASLMPVQDMQDDAAAAAPTDAAIPVATPTPSPQPEGPTPTLAPLAQVWRQVAGAENSSVVRQLQAASVIVLEKKAGYETASVLLEELPTTRQLRVIISGITGGEALEDEQVKRIHADTFYCGTPPTPTPTATPTPTPKKGTGQAAKTTPAPTPTLSPDDPYYVWRNDVVRAIETTRETAQDGSLTQTLLLTLDKTYVYRLYEDEWNYYIELVRPKDVYERIVVIDAGHGGIDAGTVSESGAYLEKNMNLDIVLRLKALLDERDDIKVYYTRTTDWKPSLRQRVNLANDVEADFFLSIHCNANVVHSLHGTEVLYAAAQNDWEGMNSRRFAQLCLEEMDEHLGLLNRGLVPRDETLTIVKYAEVPVALVEVAFMSNLSDMELLAKEETRQQAAQGLFDAILRGYEEMEGGAADEARQGDGISAGAAALCTE